MHMDTGIPFRLPGTRVLRVVLGYFGEKTGRFEDWKDLKPFRV